MSHVLVVAAVLAGFGLAALCAAVFQVTRFWSLLLMVAGFAFAVPAAIGLLTDPAPGVPWSLLALSAALSGAVVAALLVTRFATRTPGRREHRVPFRALRTGRSFGTPRVAPVSSRSHRRASLRTPR